MNGTCQGFPPTGGLSSPSAPLYIPHHIAAVGISQAKCRQAVIYILYIIKNCCVLPPTVDFKSKIPHNVRTISKKLHLDPFLISYVCFIKCFSVYPIKTAPFQCGYKPTENSPMCGINLFAGITPAPNQPNMTTITNILQPIVDDIVHTNNRLTIVTPQYSHGRRFIVRLAALLGDVVATHKVAGFMSNLAKFFCSWYMVWKANMDEMTIGRLHTKQKTLALSHQWKDDEMV
ncbi:hypothetical protein VP01_1913g3 [Puccinia sorghi]|uniref:Uncharacterized protein n=1 Tax=Puccinia sorghi TaxID=27349 RepID=A0A0L6VCM3_9BASI|nr:hypothetical protein VP01_1913g3 [Puccinia sorghi]